LLITAIIVERQKEPTQGAILPPLQAPVHILRPSSDQFREGFLPAAAIAVPVLAIDAKATIPAHHLHFFHTASLV